MWYRVRHWLKIGLYVIIIYAGLFVSIFTWQMVAGAVRDPDADLVDDVALQHDALGEVANMVAGGVAGFLEARHGNIHFGPPQMFSELRIRERVPPHCRVHTAVGSAEIALVEMA